jgi:phage-related baseplate assembly protein
MKGSRCRGGPDAVPELCLRMVVEGLGVANEQVVKRFSSRLSDEERDPLHQRITVVSSNG